MKLITLVLAHRAPNHVRQLASVMSQAGPVFIHVDARQPIDPYKVDAVDGGVNFLPVRNRLNWGGWSLVEATLQLMTVSEHLLKDDDYVTLISGDSYPLQSPTKILNFLQKSVTTQYINQTPFPSETVEKPISRITRAYFEYDVRDGKIHPVRKALNRAVPRSYKRALKGRQPHCGSQWWTLTGGAVKWLLKERVLDPKFESFCHRIKVPDEFYFQTLLMSSPFRSDIQRSLMYSDFTSPMPPRPAMLTSEHVNKMALTVDLNMEHRGYGTGPVLFARKCPEESKAIVSAIHERLWPLQAKRHAPIMAE